MASSLSKGIGALLAVAGLLPSPARAQGVADIERSVREARMQPVEVTADTLEYEAKRKVYTARGNVVIRQGPRTLRADWIAFNPETGAGVASGDVSLVEGRDTLTADFVEFDTQTLEGLIRQGTLDAPGSRFSAAGGEIEKTGPQTYRFRDGLFTTCRCPSEDDRIPWQIKAREAEVEVGGYGTVRDATFEVLGVPVLWFPWMIYPVKTERESGFLLPEASVGSRDGFAVGLPFFWAARENVGATLTPRWSTERGAKGDAEVEFVFGQESYGELFGAFAYDEKIDPDSLDEPYDRERWGTTGVQDFALPGALRLQSQFRFASDNDYPVDFDDLSGSKADRYLESTAALSRGFGATGRFGGNVAAWFADDLQSPEDLDRDDTLLQRLPQVQLVALPGDAGPVPWLQPSLEAEYTIFQALDRARAGGAAFADTGVDGVFDPFERGTLPDPHGDDAAAGGTEGNGRFEEGEPLADEGQRLMLQPRLAAPFRLGPFFEVYPEAGWHQTLWSTHRDDYAARGLFTGRVDLRTRLRRRYGTRYAHVVEPLLGYAYVSPEAQSGDPLLVPETALPQRRLRSLALASVTRDRADRIPRANRFTLGVSQRFYDAGSAHAGTGLEADVTLLGSYDLESEDFGLLVLDGRLVPWRLGRFRVSGGFDPEDVEIDEALLEWNWTHAAGHGLFTDYRFLRNVPNTFEEFGTGDRFDSIDTSDQVNQLGGGFRLLLTRQWWLEYRIAWSFTNDGLLANEGLVEYRSRCDCWALGVEISQDRVRGVEAKLVYRLIGLGRDVPEPRAGLLDSLGGV